MLNFLPQGIVWGVWSQAVPASAPFIAAQAVAYGLLVLAASPALAGEAVIVPCPSAQSPGEVPRAWQCCVSCVCRRMPCMAQWHLVMAALLDGRWHRDAANEGLIWATLSWPLNHKILLVSLLSSD